MKREDFVFSKQDERYKQYKKNAIWKEIAPIIEQIYKNLEYKVKQPDLLGKTVKVTSRQFTAVNNITVDIADEMKIKPPNVYVYEDFYYGAESYGMKGNYWIEISAKTITDFSNSELKFLLGREIYKIADGVTDEATLVQHITEHVPGSIGKIMQITLYRWYRCANYSADNFGYLCCRNITDAVNTILKLVLNSTILAKAVDVSEFMKQTSEINRLHDKIYNHTKLDEAVPYAPFRIKNLLAYAVSENSMKYMK